MELAAVPPEEAPLRCPGCGHPVTTPFGKAPPGPDSRKVYCPNGACKKTWKAWECLSPRPLHPGGKLSDTTCGSCKQPTLSPRALQRSTGDALTIVHCRACDWWAESQG